MFKSKKVFIIVLMGVILNILILSFLDGNRNAEITLNINITAQKPEVYQVFYSKDKSWSEENSSGVPYASINTEKEIQFNIPSDSNYIRLDLGSISSKHTISKMYLQYKNKKLKLDYTLITKSQEVNMISKAEINDKRLNIITDGQDPYCIIDISSLGVKQFVWNIQSEMILLKNIVLCIFIDLVLFFITKNGGKIILFIKELYKNRSLIFSLANNDFKTKYAGSYLGIIWAFVQPIVTVLVYWFVFQVGFHAAPISDYPYVLWLIAGLIPWFFFSDAVVGGTNSLVEYSYLVKKVVFPISTLPVVKIITAIFVHIFFILFMVIIYGFNGYMPDFYTIQILYYSFCMFFITVSISYFTCSVVVFFRDLGQIINILLQVGMWMTPIMWSDTMIPQNLRWIFKLNPMYYIVEGYRDSLIDKVWFWQNINLTLYFWILALGILATGVVLFRRLQIHFADVL